MWENYGKLIATFDESWQKKPSLNKLETYKNQLNQSKSSCLKWILVKLFL